MEDDNYTLTANTGKNDPGSVWGSGLLTNFVDLAKTGAGIYSQFSGNSTGNTGIKLQAPQAPALPQGAGVNWKQYLPWIGGAVALLLVVGLIFRRGR